MDESNEESRGALALPPEQPPAREGKRGRLRRQLSAAAAVPDDTAPTALAPALPSWPEPGEHVRVLLDMRRNQKRRFLQRLALYCGLPTLLTGLYMTFIASPRYISEFEVTYQTYQAPQKLSSGIVQNLLGTSQNNTVDLGLILYQYIQSTTLLTKLDSELHLRKYLSDPKVDFLSRMSPRASLALFQLYYNWYVSVSYSLGGFLTIDVQGFDPAFALKLSQAIVKACDQMINDMTARARQDEVTYAEDELKLEEQRVRKARLALTDFQNGHGDINPPRSAGQLSGLVGSLTTELATAQTQLTTALSYLSPNSPQVAEIKYKIAALQDQLKKQRSALATDAAGVKYSSILQEYSALELDEEFAKNAYQAAQQGLEVARADAARQQSYLVDFAKPYLPDRASVAVPVLYTLTAFMTSLVLFGIGSLIGAAFRDHAGM